MITMATVDTVATGETRTSTKRRMPVQLDAGTWLSIVVAVVAVALTLEATLAQCLVDDATSLGIAKGLNKVISRSQTECLNRNAFRAMGSHQNNWHVIAFLGDQSQKVKATNIGKL